MNEEHHENVVKALLKEIKTLKKDNTQLNIDSRYYQIEKEARRNSEIAFLKRFKKTDGSIFIPKIHVKKHIKQLGGGRDE